MAHLSDKGERCTLCNTADWQFDPLQGGRPDAFVAVLHDCKGCKIKQTFQSTLPQDLPAGQSVILITRRENDRLTYDPRAKAQRPMARRNRRRQQE